MDKHLVNLQKQLLISNEMNISEKCQELLQSCPKNLMEFSDAIEKLWGYCEGFNPEFGGEDEFLYNEEQLKTACEQFLNKIKQL